jgi:large subunit ribosomal protein L23
MSNDIIQINNEIKLLKVLTGARTSEKSSILAEKHKQYVFEILKTSNKIMVKKAVEFLFKVKVSKVQIINLPHKKKRFGKITGIKNGIKKAYVRLEEGHDINLMAKD